MDSSDQSKLIKLKQAIDENDGSNEVILVLGPDESKQILKLPMKMSSTKIAVGRVQEIVGAKNVKLV